MRRKGTWLGMALLAVTLLPKMASSVRAATEISGDHVQIRLLALPGPATDTLAFGVEFRLDPEWHVYWRNPGDSGAAPKFKVEAEGGQVLGPIWPAPERIPLGTLTNYGYNERVLFPFSVQLDAGREKVDLNLDLEWLVCKVDCIPGFGKMATTLSREDASQPPAPPDPLHPLPREDPDWSLKFLPSEDQDASFELENANLDFKALREIQIFPFDGELFATTAPSFQLEEQRLLVKVPWAVNSQRSFATTDFLLKYREEGKPWKAVLLHAEKPTDRGTFPRALLLAFLGGLLLNLMPCVFPVLSIKALSLAREAHDRPALRLSGLGYTAGVLAAFGALGGILLLLRAGGQALGWGFQLQSPLFVFAMALLFFAIGLNFLGFFEIGNSWMQIGGRLQSRASLQSAFGTGLLATLIATPCTAPFMGSALGFSLLLEAWQAWLIFLALGLGMALPLLALCYFPWWTRRLPKPGAWMQRLREAFAFPMFLTAVWLGWVLLRQTGPRAFLALGAAAVGTAGALWIFRWGAGRWGFRLVGTLLLAASLTLPAFSLKSSSAPEVSSTSPWENYSEAALSEASAQGRPAFIDFTAAWCITCQWNKKTVLEKKEILALFEANEVSLLRADWTDQDEEITRALAGYGRNSVPLYVYKSAQGETKLLPELLSMEDIQNLFRVSAVRNP